MKFFRQRFHVHLAQASGILAAALAFTGCAMHEKVQRLDTRMALQQPSPLSGYIRACYEPGPHLFGRDGFEVLNLTPSVRPHFRRVLVAGSPDSVSVQAGHRLMYGFRDAGYFFANVKIERSQAAYYERDKQVILRQLGAFADSGSRQVLLAPDGLTVHGYEADALDKGGVIGMYTAFLDSDQLVVSAYLLNQGKTARRFHSMDEYRALRDRFLADLAACVGAAAPPAP